MTQFWERFPDRRDNYYSHNHPNERGYGGSELLESQHRRYRELQYLHQNAPNDNEKLLLLGQMQEVLRGIRAMEESFRGNIRNRESQNNYFPFQIKAWKKDSYDYLSHVTSPTTDRNIWEMTVVFQKYVSNAHIPVQTIVHFRIINEPGNRGVVMEYNGRSFYLAPEYTNRRQPNLIQIEDMKFEIEFYR